MDEATLFRANSMVSNVTTAYFQLIGKPYLKQTLYPSITKIDPETSYEVDPSKMNKDGEDMEKNMTNLLLITQSFLDDILASINNCPL